VRHLSGFIARGVIGKENLPRMTNFKHHNWPKTKLVTWIRKVTPRCREITHLLSQSMDRRLTIHKRLGIWLHFTVCDFCVRYSEHLAFIRRASRSIPERLTEMLPRSLPEAAKERMRHKLAGARR
jgi:hypothetical protein